MRYQGTINLAFTPALKKRILAGVVIGIVMVSFFVIGAGNGKPEWGSYWRIKPLLLTPVLCGIVGLCYDLTESLRKLNAWPGKIFILLSLIGYLGGLWIALVLGLAGTMWN